MDAWARELLDVWKTNIRPLAETFIEKIATNPELTVRYSVGDVEQMANGIYAMMEEELDGRGREVYATYLQSVIPALVMQGEGLPTMVRSVTLNAVIIHQAIVDKISDTHRKAVSEYLMNWWANHNADVTKIALDMMKEQS